MYMGVRKYHHKTVYRKETYKYKKSRRVSVVVQRQAANQRERRRMLSINDAFEGLRTHIPTLPYEKKLSKVDTLRLAINYIHFLQELIETTKLDNEENGIKKVIINSSSSQLHKLSSSGDVVLPVMGHSLSWRREGDVDKIKIRTSCIWTPSIEQLQQSQNTSSSSTVPRPHHPYHNTTTSSDK